MLDPSHLETALRQLLPEDEAGRLARLLNAVILGEISGDQARQEVLRAGMADSLRALAGARLDVGTHTIDFGVGGQLGDVAIGDVAGQSLHRLDLSVSGGSVGQVVNQQVIIYANQVSTLPSQPDAGDAEARRRLPVGQIESPEGTMSPTSPFYIERLPGDRVALDAASRQGETVTVKGPRQVGKSSLLARVMDRARASGKRVIYLDFQSIDYAARADASIFYRQLCSWLSDELGLADQTDAYWRTPLSQPQLCIRYMERHVIPSVGGPLLIALDEVDSILESPFRNDFFAMLRVWHNNRATRPVWAQLDLALVTSTEPYQLVADLTKSPFNVGHVIDLDDFSPGQVADLNRRHNSPLAPEDEARLSEWLNGHPYLVRRALYLVADGRVARSELFAAPASDPGPFSDHLRRHFQLLQDRPELWQGLGQVIRSRSCPDDRLYWRLHGAGLVRREGQRVVPRCKLYERYFAERMR